MNQQANGGGLEGVLLSADSHIAEPLDLWETRLPESLRGRAPHFDEKNGQGMRKRAGGWDPNERLKDMAIDGVSGEVLYPSLGLLMYAGDDIELEEACFATYNDWLSEYCQSAPDRLWGLAMISLYNIENAVKELERTRKKGLVGATIWQTPPEHLLFTSSHYDRFWSAAESLDMPVSLHILTGHGHTKHGHTKGERPARDGIEQQRNSVNYKQLEIFDALLDIIDSGVLERHPRLKIVAAENDVGWIPYWLQLADLKIQRWRMATPLSMLPSEYFQRQVYATFIDDEVGGQLLARWGQENFMWSSDYPHTSGIWPRSRECVVRTLGHLPRETQVKVVCENVLRLYDIPAPTALAPREINEKERDALTYHVRDWLRPAATRS